MNNTISVFHKDTKNTKIISFFFLVDFVALRDIFKQYISHFMGFRLRKLYFVFLPLTSFNQHISGT